MNEPRKPYVSHTQKTSRKGVPGTPPGGGSPTLLIKNVARLGCITIAFELAELAAFALR